MGIKELSVELISALRHPRLLGGRLLLSDPPRGSPLRRHSPHEGALEHLCNKHVHMSLTAKTVQSWSPNCMRPSFSLFLLMQCCFTVHVCHSSVCRAGQPSNVLDIAAQSTERKVFLSKCTHSLVLFSSFCRFALRSNRDDVPPLIVYTTSRLLFPAKHKWSFSWTNARMSWWGFDDPKKSPGRQPFGSRWNTFKSTVWRRDDLLRCAVNNCWFYFFSLRNGSHADDLKEADHTSRIWNKVVRQTVAFLRWLKVKAKAEILFRTEPQTTAGHQKTRFRFGLSDFSWRSSRHGLCLHDVRDRNELQCCLNCDFHLLHNLLSVCTRSSCGFWWAQPPQACRDERVAPPGSSNGPPPLISLAPVVATGRRFLILWCSITVCVSNVKWLNEKVVLQGWVCCRDKID